MPKGNVLYLELSAGVGRKFFTTIKKYSLLFLHSVIQAWKVINTKHPVYLHSRLVGNRPRYADRLAAAGSLIRGRRPRLELIESSWRWRVAKYWEEIPRSIREMENENQFKTNLKLWIRENVKI